MQREDLLARHRKETRDLIANTTSLKKQATKKTRKNVLQKCADLEQALLAKQAQELDDLDGTLADPTTGALPPPPDSCLSLPPIESLYLDAATDAAPDPQASKSDPVETLTAPPDLAAPPKKRNRQKERLEKRKLETERIKAEAAAEASNATDYRKLEMDTMDLILALRDLQLFEIRPDGNCLFALIQDQLQQRHSIETTVPELRRIAGDFILQYQHDFAPFLFDEVKCELRNVDLYVQELTLTTMWGSDMELLALGRVYDCPIVVIMAGANEVVMHPQGSKPALKVGFYKHSFGLGEHYNSLRDKC